MDGNPAELLGKLRVAEARQALLLGLLHGLRKACEPDVMMRAAAAAIGQYLRADRVGFFEMAGLSAVSGLEIAGVLRKPFTASPIGPPTSGKSSMRRMRRRVEKIESMLGKMLCLTTVFVLVNGTDLPAQEKKPPLTDEEKLIVSQLKGLRAVPDGQRGAATKQIASEIRQLPRDAAKLGLANGLANLSTEGDFGHDTLQEVATTLAEALREQSGLPAKKLEGAYSELAQLIRYEDVKVSLDTPQLTAAIAKLEAYDRDRLQPDFTLSDVTGKQWAMKDLRGHVVLVNFWATWCPPCRKEMPDLDALYERFQAKGLVVLAISDEDAAKVNPYLAQHAVTYPVLLDPGRKVNDQFHVEGIPKSFVYDRQGKLVAQSIDMRTKGQFLELLSRAGIKD